jgi:hypothetical protein
MEEAWPYPKTDRPQTADPNATFASTDANLDHLANLSAPREPPPRTSPTPDSAFVRCLCAYPRRVVPARLRRDGRPDELDGWQR